MIAVQNLDDRFNTASAQATELPFLPSDTLTAQCCVESAGINAISWNSKYYGVLHRNGERSVEGVNAVGDEYGSGVLSRGLSYDQSTGRLPVDFQLESCWLFPAEIRGSSTVVSC